MKKAMVIVGIFIIAVIAFFIITSINNRNADLLASQDSLIRTIELPDTIERIAVKSAIGDSGGNGNHGTLRSVMLVRTELTREDLSEVFIDLGFHHIGMDVRDWDYPEFIIQQATSYQFNSPRDFRLEFEELRGSDEFARYYFIQFIR